MTRIKQAEARTIQGEKTTVEKTDYYEVRIPEVNDMLKKVAEGGDEEKLRKEIIKNSTW